MLNSLTSFSRLWTMVGSTPPSFPLSTVSSFSTFVLISLSKISSSTRTVLTHMSGLFLATATAILVATLMWWLGEHTHSTRWGNTHDKLWMDQYLDHGCGWSVTSFNSSSSFSARLSSSESSLQYQWTPVYMYMYSMPINAHTHARTHAHTRTYAHTHTHTLSYAD